MAERKIRRKDAGMETLNRFLEIISEDRITWIQCYHRLKDENDRESQLLYARREGIKEGVKKGIMEGKIEGKIEAALNIYTVKIILKTAHIW